MPFTLYFCGFKSCMQCKHNLARNKTDIDIRQRLVYSRTLILPTMP